jgi:hypothetical protein
MKQNTDFGSRKIRSATVGLIFNLLGVTRRYPLLVLLFGFEQLTQLLELMLELLSEQFQL